MNRRTGGLQWLSWRSAIVGLVLTTGATRLSRTDISTNGQRADSLRVARLFADGMVVQRDKPLVVWGAAAAGSSVTVRFRGHASVAHVDHDGRWKTSVPAGAAGGPFELTVQDGAEHVVVRDALVGDVWVASGQSNMELELSRARDAAAELAAANDSRIRQFKVPISWSNTPEDELVGGAWTPADPAHAADFSAVAYFFARELRKSVDVPIGIINTTWGGSAIETWLSRGAQHITDSSWNAIIRADEAKKAALRDALRARIGSLPEHDAGMNGTSAPWADPSLDDSGWTTIPVPAYWEANGYDGMDGVAWYRRTFDLDSAQARGDVSLHMDAIDDDDITWVNGVEVGRTNGYNVARVYRLSPAVLRTGRNTIAVRVTDGGGGGGINAAVSLAFADGSARSLAGTWKFKVGEVSFHPDAQQTNKIPTVAYNRMVHPILPFAIKGVLWYQGESNANDMAQARAYRAQFASLITSWRREFGSGRDVFPFLWVQLPNYNPADSVPPLEATWATQRESMDAALALPKTGRAVTIDVGEGDNLHPRNKQDVGARLALVARNVAYGASVVASGPTYRSHTVHGDSVTVAFSNTSGGLVTHGAADVGGFAIAGADRHFVWANAKVAGTHVVVWSDAVKHPVAVRYAWANNPDRANLFNGEGLPAAPFRTDRW